MVKPEFTGKRDLTYNVWHRTIGSQCYMVDLDCVEWRSNRGIVAIIERACDYQIYPRSSLLQFKKFEIKVASEMATKLSVPSFLVFYDEALTKFDVYHIIGEEPIFLQTFNSDDYAKFLNEL